MRSFTIPTRLELLGDAVDRISGLAREKNWTGDEIYGLGAAISDAIANAMGQDQGMSQRREINQGVEEEDTGNERPDGRLFGIVQLVVEVGGEADVHQRHQEVIDAQAKLNRTRQIVHDNGLSRYNERSSV